MALGKNSDSSEAERERGCTVYRCGYYRTSECRRRSRGPALCRGDGPSPLGFRSLRVDRHGVTRQLSVIGGRALIIDNTLTPFSASLDAASAFGLRRSQNLPDLILKWRCARCARAPESNRTVVHATDCTHTNASLSSSRTMSVQVDRVLLGFGLSQLKDLV